MEAPPRVLVLDGDNLNALSIVRELSEDLDATIVGVGTTEYSRILRSKYCDRGMTLPASNEDAYRDGLRSLIETTRPDAILPVGARSTIALDAIRSAVPEDVSLCLPSVEAFRAARDKATTLSYGERIGLDTPTSYSRYVSDLDDDGRPVDGLSRLPFPLFLKARLETDGVTTDLVRRPARFWDAYDRLATAAPNGEVIVQEYIGGSSSTFGCGLLFQDNEVELVFGHEELRSVPRRGGSGTHLRIHRDPHMESSAIRLLREIGWHGVALVEFKRRPDGSLVLMEVNPKFWASYALASAYGYRFATTMVANALELETERSFGSPEPAGEMTFPLRELRYYLHNRSEESLWDCLRSTIKPGVPMAMDLRDPVAWLTPPAGVTRRLPWTRTPAEPRAESERRGETTSASMRPD